MEGLFRMVSDHPLLAMGAAFLVLVGLYVVFSKLFKLVLVLVLIVVALGGFFYFQKPGQRPASFGEAVAQVREGAGHLWQKGRAACEGARTLFERGREGVDRGKALLDQGKAIVEKGVEKGRQATGEVGKRLGGQP